MCLYEMAPDIGACACKWKSTVIDDDEILFLRWNFFSNDSQNSSYATDAPGIHVKSEKDDIK